MDILFFLQETVGGGLQQAAPVKPALNLPEVAQPTTMDQLINGWYIYVPQLLLSFVAVYIFIERSMALGRADKEESNFMAKIKDYISQGKLDSAKNLCSTSQTPVARMIEKGISRIGKPLDDISKAIENVGKLEVFKMERNLGVLAIIAAIAPMLGFLGTVFGVITIFHDIAEVGSLQISAVSEGLYIKMISSAIGLLVGMIAYIGYNTLVTRVGKVINKMEAHAVEFIDILEEPTN